MNNIKQRLDAANDRYNAARVRHVTATKHSAEADAALVHAHEAASLIRKVAQAIQTAAHARLANVATRCLAVVYDDSYEFAIEFVERRGKTEAEAVFKRDGHTFDPTEDSGGGCVDVAAFALRLAALGARKPPLRKLLVLDEPFRFCDRQARMRVGSLLEMLCQESGLQIIMATHWDELRIGKVIEL